MFYLVTAPWWLRKWRPGLVWQMPATEKKLYLTFDDGPHPTATPFILDALKKYNAKATFFCIGKNIIEHREIYKRILEEGHRVGNHSFNHLNGWKTDNEKYIENIYEASKYIDSNLFRPPYGRITRFQEKLLKKNFKIIMWSLLSGDFDRNLSPEKCLQNVLLNAKPGSIIVFHDSTKAWERMSYILPIVLAHFSDLGYLFSVL